MSLCDLFKKTSDSGKIRKLLREATDWNSAVISIGSRPQWIYFDGSSDEKNHYVSVLIGTKKRILKKIPSEIESERYAKRRIRDYSERLFRILDRKGVNTVLIDHYATENLSLEESIRNLKRTFQGKPVCGVRRNY